MTLADKGSRSDRPAIRLAWRQRDSAAPHRASPDECNNAGWSAASSGSTISVSEPAGSHLAGSSGRVAGPSAGVTAMRPPHTDASCLRPNWRESRRGSRRRSCASCVVTRVWRSRASVCSTSSSLTCTASTGRPRASQPAANAISAKPAAGHHGLPMHLVIGQPRHHLGSDICLPHMVAARRHLNVHPKQRVSIWQSAARATDSRSNISNAATATGEYPRAGRRRHRGP